MAESVRRQATTVLVTIHVAAVTGLFWCATVLKQAAASAYRSAVLVEIDRIAVQGAAARLPIDAMVGLGLLRCREDYRDDGQSQCESPFVRVLVHDQSLSKDRRFANLLVPLDEPVNSSCPTFVPFSSEDSFTLVRRHRTPHEPPQRSIPGFAVRPGLLLDIFVLATRKPGMELDSPVQSRWRGGLGGRPGRLSRGLILRIPLDDCSRRRRAQAGDGKRSRHSLVRSVRSGHATVVVLVSTARLFIGHHEAHRHSQQLTGLAKHVVATRLFHSSASPRRVIRPLSHAGDVPKETQGSLPKHANEAGCGGPMGQLICRWANLLASIEDADYRLLQIDLG